MNLLNALNAFYASDHLAGAGLAGTFNIESGSMEVKGDYFGECECSRNGGLVVDCSLCGRNSGNHVRFLSGRGDGVYSGVSLYADGGRSLLAAVYVLDEDNTFAGTVMNEVASNSISEWQQLLAEACKPYFELPCSEIATVRGGSGTGVLVGDAHAGHNSNFAVVDHWFTANADFRVVIACEPILASPGVELALELGGSPDSFTGGYAASIRPRAVILVRADFPMPALDDQRVDSHDWLRQAEAWRKMLVSSNMVGGNNVAAIYTNGLNWRNIQKRHYEMVGDTDDMWFIYGFNAYGWFVLGAYFGDDDCRELMLDMIHESGGELADPGNIQTAVDRKGWSVTPELVAFVRGALDS